MATNIEDLRKKAKLPVKQAGGGTVANFFEQNKATIKAVLPQHVTPERMLKIALGAIRTTPKLQEATSESLFGAVVTCAQMGLEPNTPNGHAYLIPFRNNQKGQTDVQVIIGYRGFIDLARRSGQIVSISAHAVRENDEFSYEYGLDEHCKHVPAPSGNRGEITHFYAVAKLVGGGHAFEVLSREGVETIRDNSSNWKTAVRYNNTAKSIWTLHFEEMGRKTLIRRLYKYLPTSIEMVTANQLDAKASSGEAQDLDGVLDGEFTVDHEGVPEAIVDEGTAPSVDSNGEEFDPEQHLAPDRFNKDGSFTKRPHRAKQGEQEPAPNRDPLADFVNAMEAATDLDQLDAARDRANDPAHKLEGSQLTALDGFYNSVRHRLEAAESDDMPPME